MAGTSSSTLTLNIVPTAVGIRFTEDSMQVELRDGRVLQAPLCWFPRLEHATSEERGDFEFFQEGVAIHWPPIDEDIRITDLLAGRRSQESEASLKRWIDTRAN